MKVTKSKTYNSDFAYAKIEEKILDKIVIRYYDSELYFHKLVDFEKWLVEVNELHKILTQELK